MWFAIHFSDLKCLDKRHQQMAFKHLDAHITLAYPSVDLWEVAGPRLLAIVKDWIVERQQRSANGVLLCGHLEWHEDRMTHNRFVSLDIQYDAWGGLHYLLAELSRRLHEEFSQFPSRDRFHISLKDSNETLCEFIIF